MSRSFAAIALLSMILAGCGQAPRTAAPLAGGGASAKAIGCVPGQCGGGSNKPIPKPPAPCAPHRPVGNEAIGCLPGECDKPLPKPCR